MRKPIEFSKKLAFYKKLGFDGGQFHDDAAGRQFTTDRSKRTIDIANAPGTELIFLKLLEISGSLNDKFIAKCTAERDFEELDLYFMKSLLRR